MKTSVLSRLGMSALVAFLLATPAVAADNASKEALDVQQKFFQAIQSGNPDKVLEHLHQDLLAALDRPVLHAWMTAVKEHLGDVKGISQKGLRGTYKFDKQVSQSEKGEKSEKQVRVLNAAARVVFTKGTAQSELWVHEGKIIRFEVTSDKIPDNWIKDIQDTEMYRAEGAAFLKVLLEGEHEMAYDLQHETLQKVMTLEKLKAIGVDAKANVGKVKTVTWKSERFDIQPEKYKLRIRYKVVCEKESTDAVVDFQFLKMEARIVAFDLTGKEK